MRSERACDDGRPHCVIIIGRRKREKKAFFILYILLGNKDVTALDEGGETQLKSLLLSVQLRFSQKSNTKSRRNKKRKPPRH